MVQPTSTGGVDELPSKYIATGVQCDMCGVIVHPDVSHGRRTDNLWKVDMRTAAWLDFGWSGKNEKDYCPSCTEKRGVQRVRRPNVDI